MSESDDYKFDDLMKQLKQHCFQTGECQIQKEFEGTKISYQIKLKQVISLGDDVALITFNNTTEVINSVKIAAERKA